MTERLRSTERSPVAREAGDGPPDQQSLRDEAAALIQAADDAISRVLSRDSVEFLAQNRQSGGQ